MAPQPIHAHFYLQHCAAGLPQQPLSTSPPQLIRFIGQRLQSLFRATLIAHCENQRQTLVPLYRQSNQRLNIVGLRHYIPNPPNHASFSSNISPGGFPISECLCSPCAWVLPSSTEARRVCGHKLERPFLIQKRRLECCQLRWWFHSGAHHHSNPRRCSASPVGYAGRRDRALPGARCASRINSR